MYLADREINKLIDQGELQIIVGSEYPPFNPSEQIGASTIDLRLSRVFRKYKPEVKTVDLTQIEETTIIEIPLDGELIIQPREFILGLTVEILKLPTNIEGYAAATSTIARIGLQVVDQPFIHPGYTGSVALQLYNKLDRPVKINPLMTICQVQFQEGTSYALNPYGSKNSERYQGEFGTPRAPQRIGGLDKNKHREDIPIDFAIVTALRHELHAILLHLGSYKKIEFNDDILSYYRGRIHIPETDEYYEVVVTMLLGMGNPEAGWGSMKVIEKWQPKSIIMVGIAAGIPTKVSFGDIVVANYVYDYGLGKITPTGEERRPQQFPTDRFLYGRALAFEYNDWRSKITLEPPKRAKRDTPFPKVHFGAIACGNKVLADGMTLNELVKECPELKAYAMEGAGVAGAANHQSSPLRFLEIRSICDYANPEKNDKWQAFAAEAAAAFTISFLRSGPVPPIITE